ALRAGASEPVKERGAAGLDPAEALTLDLVVLHPRLWTHQFVERFPAELRGQLYQINLDSGEKAYQVAGELRDDAVRAFCQDKVAGCLRQMGNGEAARVRFQEATAIYRELARQRMEVYGPRLAGILHDLAGLAKDAGDLRAARDSYQEALAVYPQVARLRSVDYRPQIAGTLNIL